MRDRTVITFNCCLLGTNTHTHASSMRCIWPNVRAWCPPNFQLESTMIEPSASRKSFMSGTGTVRTSPLGVLRGRTSRARSAAKPCTRARPHKKEELAEVKLRYRTKVAGESQRTCRRCREHTRHRASAQSTDNIVIDTAECAARATDEPASANVDRVCLG